MARQQPKFKKDHFCPVEACRNKYSSKIALRTHLRRKHTQWVDNSQL